MAGLREWSVEMGGWRGKCSNFFAAHLWRCWDFYGFLDLFHLSQSHTLFLSTLFNCSWKVVESMFLLMPINLVTETTKPHQMIGDIFHENPNDCDTKSGWNHGNRKPPGLGWPCSKPSRCRRTFARRGRSSSSNELGLFSERTWNLISKNQDFPIRVSLLVFHPLAFEVWLPIPARIGSLGRILPAWTGSEKHDSTNQLRHRDSDMFQKDQTTTRELLCTLISFIHCYTVTTMSSCDPINLNY